MPTGMKYPVRVSPLGGAVTIDGYKTIGQNIILAVQPASNLNPWMQDITPDEDYIFQINDTVTGGLYNISVRRFFDEMERLGYARLFPSPRGIVITRSSKNPEEMIAIIKYLNLESGKPDVVKVPMAFSGGR